MTCWAVMMQMNLQACGRGVQAGDHASAPHPYDMEKSVVLSDLRHFAKL